MKRITLIINEIISKLTNLRFNRIFVNMIIRHISKHILAYSKQYPVLALVGPRQSGKTTLVQALFPSYKYLSLENINIRQSAIDDPEGFLETHGPFLILDEIQQVPELFSYLQGKVDANQEPAQYILTGSSQFLLMEQITQTLAGRIITFKLFPLTFTELHGYAEDNDADAIFRTFFPSRPKVSQEELYQLLLTGLYPRIYDKQLDSGKWYENYVATYVERDVRSLLNIRNLRTFEHFLLLCASRSGQLLDYSDLSSALGIAVSTVKEWVSVLEASGIVFLLTPYFENFSKRIVKTPKLYFIDTGLLCHLLSIRTIDHLKGHPLLGWIFETFIISECFKRFHHAATSPRLYFWRDQTQNEIDLLIYNGREGFPVEVKCSQSYHPDFRKTLESWISLKGNPAKQGTIIYCGDLMHTTQSIPTIPWYML
ncbi:MAG: ATP-binding protein [Chlamydiae bacterium]|nr:ATP-binding protein [Chlamydiota bacterium]